MIFTNIFESPSVLKETQGYLTKKSCPKIFNKIPELPPD